MLDNPANSYTKNVEELVDEFMTKIHIDNFPIERLKQVFLSLSLYELQLLSPKENVDNSIDLVMLCLKSKNFWLFSQIIEIFSSLTTWKKLRQEISSHSKTIADNIEHYIIHHHESSFIKQVMDLLMSDSVRDDKNNQIFSLEQDMPRLLEKINFDYSTVDIEKHVHFYKLALTCKLNSALVNKTFEKKHKI